MSQRTFGRKLRNCILLGMKKCTILFELLLALILILSCTPGQETAGQTEEPAASVLPLIHPDFLLTLPDLKELIQDQPEEIIRAIMNRPQYFLELTGRLLDLPGKTLVLVNKTEGITAEDNPGDLLELDDYKDTLILSRPGHSLRRQVLPNLLAMNEAARQEGLSLMISSTYRPYEYQEFLYNRYVEQDGQEEADRYSARPGHSQHQLGTVIDFGTIDESFAKTPEGKWLFEHAREYGFSLTYPKGLEDLTGYMWESWHYRYITPVGTEMEKEFFLGIQEYMLRFFHEKRDELEKSRKG